MSNDWQKRFGAARRAIDRAILAECERRIAAEDRQATETGSGRPRTDFRRQTPAEPETGASEARSAIARAFGRPLH